MHITVDVRQACAKRRTGKGQWTFGFVTELLRSGVTCTLLTDAAIPDEWGLQPSTVVQTFPSGAIWHFRAWQYLRRRGIGTLYLSPTSFIVPLLLGRNISSVVVVHDLIAFRREPHSHKARLLERLFLPRALKVAYKICCVSESTKTDLRKRFKFLREESVTVLYAGPSLHPPLVHKDDRKTILCVGTLSPRKNQRRLIEAYALLPDHLRSRYELCLAGARGWCDKEILQMVKKTTGVSWRNYIDQDEYQKLLTSCTAFALPSLYEGFGMQVLDALLAGAPILTSDRGSLREVAGDVALYADPEDVYSIRNGLVEFLTNEGLRSDASLAGPLQASKFTWERAVEIFLKCLTQVVA